MPKSKALIDVLEGYPWDEDAPKNPHAVILGRRGGKATSAAKTKAVRENGKKGGRPKKAVHDGPKEQP
jgi:hypothetical protein